MQNMLLGFGPYIVLLLKKNVWLFIEQEIEYTMCRERFWVALPWCIGGDAEKSGGAVAPATSMRVGSSADE
jgi:hypothetical protein